MDADDDNMKRSKMYTHVDMRVQGTEKQPDNIYHRNLCSHKVSMKITRGGETMKNTEQLEI